MLPSEITGSSETQAAQAEAKASAATLGREDFLRMLIAQLENQDPLNPQDATEFTAQLAQFSSLEQLLSMRESLDDVVESQAGVSTAIQGLASSSLIGREVVARAERFEIGADGSPTSLPALELHSAATSATLLVRNSQGATLRVLDLGPLRQGFQRIPEALLTGSGLAPGVYGFEVSALSGSESVEATRFAVGRVSGAIPTAADPLVQIGGVVVPYSDVSEIREARP